MPVEALTFRLVKGTPLSSVEGDQNLRILRDAINALEQLFGVVLNNDGTLKSGAVGATAVIADGIITAAKLAADARIPAGMVASFAGAAAPSGWLLADGSAVSRTTYAALFTAIGTTHGVGDGSLTFNLPDGRGRVAVGAGTGTALTARTLGVKFGFEEITLLADQCGVPEHAHSIQANGSDSGTTGDVFTKANGANVTAGNTQDNVAQDAADAHGNCQPSLVLNLIIKI